MGSGPGRLWWTGDDLRYGDDVADCVDHRRTGEFWYCLVSDRAITSLVEKALGNGHRVARGYSFYCLRHVGFVGIQPDLGYLCSAATASVV